jgi:hypothetical protein
VTEAVTNIETLEPTELWPKVLAEIKKHHNTLYTLARMAKTSTGPNNLRLEFEFAFHQKRLNESKNKQIIYGIIERLTGHHYDIECVVVTPVKSANPSEVGQTKKTDDLATISNIFGDAEVLES